MEFCVAISFGYDLRIRATASSVVRGTQFETNLTSDIPERGDMVAAVAQCELIASESRRYHRLARARLVILRVDLNQRRDENQ
jgi:hypothetical protein